MKRDARSIRRPRGFTIVELCLGMLVTGFVMTAMAAFSLAMAQQWESSSLGQGLTLRGNQAALRIANEIRGAKQIGACQLGSSTGLASGAAVVLWKTDSNSDGLIQANEVEMIAHIPASNTLVIYPAGSLTGTATWSYSTQFVSPTYAIAQFATAANTIISRDVYGAVFETQSSSSKTTDPTLIFALKIRDTARITPKTHTLVQYGSATVRAPLAQPGN